MGLEKTGETKNWENEYQDLAPNKETLETMESLERDSFVELTKSAAESEGFMYIPAENIWINPQKRIIRFTEPEQMLGAEEFKLRDQIEHAWPVGAYSPPLEAENQILRGIEKGEVKPFHPHLGGRICFHEIPVFETKNETLIPISILPDSGQRYAGHVKSLGSNLVRGNKFPEAKTLKNFARSRVANSLDEVQAQNPFEKIVTKGEHGDIRTGFWTVEFVGKKGKTANITRISDCHVARDPETGTFDIFHINKRYVFDMENDLRVWENIPGPTKLKRVMALVTLENFKKAEKGKPLKLERVFHGEKEIRNLADIPHEGGADKKYRHLFSQAEEGFFLNNFKAVPPTEEFQRFEKMVVEQVPEKSVSQMKQHLGQLTEKLAGQILEVSKNPEMLHISVPNGAELEDLMKNQPEAFQSWARSMQGEVLTVNPDFILKAKGRDPKEKLFVEVKYSYPVAEKHFKQQYYRMILYKLIKGEAPNITVISTEGSEGPHPDFTGVNFINIFNKKYRNKLDAKILQEISVYEKKLKRAPASGRP